MKFFVNSRSGVPIYKQLVQQIEKGIAGGILQPGDQLPTVREVALELTVNPNTVARAYRELEYLGIIESVQGRGTFISKNVSSPRREKRARIIKHLIKDLITEAQQLDLPPEELKELFEEALKEWEKGDGQYA